MNWYRIRINVAERHFCGTSEETIEQLTERADRGEFIRLGDLVYFDRGDVKDWSEWDARDIPAIFICGKNVVTIMQLKGDPRTMSHTAA